MSQAGPTVAGVTPTGLDSLWLQVADRLTELGVPVFPAMPQPDRLAVAGWPGQDWSAFLDVAARAGAPLLYAQSVPLEDEDLDVLTDAAADLTAAHAGFTPEHQDYPGPELFIDAAERAAGWRATAAAARCRVGAVGRIEVAFVAAGVLHSWSTEDEQYATVAAAQRDVADARTELEELHRQAYRAAQRPARSYWAVTEQGEHLLRQLQPRVQQVAADLLASPAFVGGASQQARWRLAAHAVPELGEWLGLPDWRENPESWARHRAAQDACLLAEERLPAVREQRLTALRSQEAEVAAQIAADPEFADRRTKPVRRQFVRDLVTQSIGFYSAELVDRLLERADELRRL